MEDEWFENFESWNKPNEETETDGDSDNLQVDGKKENILDLNEDQIKSKMVYF